MKKEDARDKIRELWRTWASNDPHSADALLFFGWLRQNHPETLNFRAAGDKWQHVRSWIQDK